MDYHTHLVPFCGKIIGTTVIDKAPIAENWVLNIRSKFNGQKIIARLNCKWKPHPIRSMSSKIATLQLCIDTKCLAIQLLYLNYMPKSIKSFLSDSTVIFVGIEIEETMLKLQNEYGLSCSKKIDVRSLARVHFPLSFYGETWFKSSCKRIGGAA
ncbi:hypothetical protein QQP08_000431 [Theobroma cacao]|uniref:Uncharacterized protein n=1 Tax=Theobroma cacao TaxID=3641 RepID=A0A061DRI5_THECC|nr:Uncharacterized protein TCM_004849 [Theobroma cacao]WRX07944.1 hypothetical protein QQP08_000431 [Theobroma cacao]